MSEIDSINLFKMKRKADKQGFGFAKPSKDKKSKSDSVTRGYKGFKIPNADWNIDKISLKEITPSQFFHNYVMERKPCIFTDVTSETDFNKLSKWTNNYLCENAGDVELQIEKRNGEKANFGESAPRLPMKFQALLDAVDEGSSLYYLTSQTEDYEGSDLPALLASPLTQLQEDLVVRPLVSGGLIPYQCNVWMGNSANGTTSGLHHDYHDNIYVLLRGAKRFNVFSPADADKLSMRGDVSSVHPNGLIVYKTSLGISENGIPLFALRKYYRELQDLCETLSSQGKEYISTDVFGDLDVDYNTLHNNDIRIITGDWSSLNKESATKRLQGLEYVLDYAIDNAMELDLKYGEEESLDEQDQDDDDKDAIFPHFSGIPLSMLYAQEPRVPPQINQNPDDKLMSQLSTRIQPFEPLEQMLKKHPDWKVKYNKFLLATKGSVVILPNESLYLPCGWFHEVTSYNLDDTSLLPKFAQEKGHLAVNYWFHPPNTWHKDLDSVEDEDILNRPYKDMFWAKHWKQHYSKYNRSSQ